MGFFRELVLRGITRRIWANPLYEWLLRASTILDGGNAPSSDPNSLLTGDVASVEWRSITPGSAPKIEVNVSRTGAPPSTSYVNVDGAAPGTGVLEAIVGVPPGVTKMTLKVPACLPTGVGAATIYAEVRTYPGNVLLGSMAPALSTAFTTYERTVTVTPSTDVIVRLYFNGAGSSAQARALVGTIALEPSTFAAPFPFTAGHHWSRYRVTPDVLWENGWSQFIRGRTFARSPYCRLRIETNAPFLVVQQFNTMKQFGATLSPDFNGTFVVIDGKFTEALGLPFSAGTIEDYAEVTLPNDGDVHTVDVWGSTAEDDSTGRGLPEHWWQTYVDGILVPDGTVFRVLTPPTSPNGLVVYGDSILAGYLATTPEQGVNFCIRDELATSAAFETVSSATLYNDTNNGADIRRLADRLQRHAPSIVYLGIGRNDWGFSTISAANFGILYGRLVDALHTRDGDLQIVCQSPVVQALEGPNGFGNTLGDYRAAILAVTTTRDWCSYVDGAAILTSPADLDVDGIHPNNQGSAKLARKVVTTVETLTAANLTETPGQFNFGGLNVSTLGNLGLGVVANLINKIRVDSADVANAFFRATLNGGGGIGFLNGGTGGQFLLYNCDYVGSQFIARALYAVIIAAQDIGGGQSEYQIFGNVGLVPGNAFSPTLLWRVNTTTGAVTRVSFEDIKSIAEPANPAATFARTGTKTVGGNLQFGAKFPTGNWYPLATEGAKGGIVQAITSKITVNTNVTGDGAFHDLLTAAITTNGGDLEITAFASGSQTTAAANVGVLGLLTLDAVNIELSEGAGFGATLLGQSPWFVNAYGRVTGLAAGAHTIKLRVEANAGVLNINPLATGQGYLVVREVWP